MIQRSTHHLARQHRSNQAGIEAISIASNRQFPRHAHDTYGLGLLDRGAHRTWSPIGRVEAVAGDVITINPEEMHDGVPIANGTRHWRMMYFDQAVVAGAAGDEALAPLEIARPVLRDAGLRDQLNRVFALVTSVGHDPLAVEEAIARVFMMVRHRHSAENAPAHAAVPGVARALQRLDHEPCAAVSLAELAATAGVSRFQLIRGFARAVGVTPYAYQVQRRVRSARRFISEGRPLAEAAAEAGFSDQSHMTRAFVRQLGVTPARYRAALGIAARPDRNIVQDA